MENIIEFKSVYKAFDKLDVLRSLSFSVAPKTTVGLIGNNGCGKTTTINVLCNLMDYDQGEILVFGRRVDRSYVDYKGQFGIVMSKPYYIEEFTPIEQLYFVCKFQKIPDKRIQQRIADTIQLMDLERYKDQPIKELSSGNQMKVSLASALVHNPKVLVLDEPFVNLDIAATENVMHILETIKATKSMLITSHNLDLILMLCDHFLIMVDGAITMSVTRSDFETVNELKRYVKERLAVRSEEVDLSWLMTDDPS